MTSNEPPDRRPRENRIVAEPATLERCRKDYDTGSADRATAYKRMRRRAPDAR
ncbi:hypothetical protein [Streptomyces sp. NPDC048638]|uniref:hypothetical protein n=1 Tax=Streptomyces sp. NPDC048638 TaxID=3365580 RepID=UPI00370F7798